MPDAQSVVTPSHAAPSSGARAAAAATSAQPPQLLVVDDEREHAQVMCEALQRLGYRCDVAYSLGEAGSQLEKKRYDVVVTDLVMDGRHDGIELLKLAKEKSPPPPVLLVTAHGDIRTSVAAMREGAYGFIEKPLDLDYFRAQVERAVERAALQNQNIELQEQLQEQIDAQGGFEGIIGVSESMRRVVQTARQVAPSDIPVLITGESGTGKELIARAIHLHSRRRKHRMVTLNCAGLSESLLEDELFGHVRGAFTNASSDREGRFEHADEGTLFLDEIGDMPQAMQAKLLRVLENGEVVRVGANDPLRVNVRFISATNRDLDEMVAERHFREDLYFRIKGATIHIQPLRERREDIPLLIHYFIQRACERYGKPVIGLKPETQQLMMAFGWPGNVRQLRNVVENMIILAPDGEDLSPQILPTEIRPKLGSAGGMNNLVGISIEQAEKELIRNTLKMVNGNRERAAGILGIGERTLYRKIKQYELTE